jgi:hypothetical protein
MWFGSHFVLLPAKENPSLGRLELRLLFFASLISSIGCANEPFARGYPAERRPGGAPGGGDA